MRTLKSNLLQLDEELEAERQSRARADKGRGTLRRELDEVSNAL